MTTVQPALDQNRPSFERFELRGMQRFSESGSQCDVNLARSFVVASAPQIPFTETRQLPSKTGERSVTAYLTESGALAFDAFLRRSDMPIQMVERTPTHAAYPDLRRCLGVLGRSAHRFAFSVSVGLVMAGVCGALAAGAGQLAFGPEAGQAIGWLVGPLAGVLSAREASYDKVWPSSPPFGGYTPFAWVRGPAR